MTLVATVYNCIRFISLKWSITPLKISVTTQCVYAVPNVKIRVKYGSRIKAGLLYFSSNFSTYMNGSLPFEGHNVAYRCKGLDQSNIVCEYEVNLSTNKKG